MSKDRSDTSSKSTEVDGEETTHFAYMTRLEKARIRAQISYHIGKMIKDYPELNLKMPDDTVPLDSLYITYLEYLLKKRGENVDTSSSVKEKKSGKGKHARRGKQRRASKLTSDR